MIGFLSRLALFAAKSRLRGDAAGWDFARGLMWDASARLKHFADAGPLTLRRARVDQLLPDSDLTARTSELCNSDGETDPFEMLCTIAIVRAVQPHVIFEFGTFRGRTTCLFARHAPVDAEIVTLDLPPGQVEQLAIRPSRSDLQYINKPLIGGAIDPLVRQGRITQLLGDSMTYDFSPYHRRCDLIFVDAAHSYPFVRSDTANSMVMRRPNGVILWHDYKPGCPGVVRALHERPERDDMVHIEGTSLVVYGLPWRRCSPSK